MTLVVGAIGLHAAFKMQFQLSESTRITRMVRASMEADMMHDALRGHVYRTLSQTLDSPEMKQGIKNDIAEDAKKFRDELTLLDSLITSEKGHAVVKKARPAVNLYLSAAENIANKYMNENSYSNNELEAFEKAYGDLEKLMSDIGDTLETETREFELHAAQLFKTSALVVAVSAVLMGMLMFSMIRGLAVHLVKTVKVLVEQAQHIARGDLAHQMASNALDDQSKNELHVLALNMAQMQTALQNIVREVRNNADGVAVASEQIAAGNTNLAVRTSHQAEHLRQTSDSMSEFRHMIDSTAQVAQQASTLATQASDVAQRGGAVVDQVASTMGNITSSSKRIGDIVGTIDSIAFQTNLLALNAAVEAARAGEQGKGFAVVAAEVRQLAQRSASAAREIAQLVHSSVKEIQSGAQLTEQAGNTMREVVSAVLEVTRMIGEISQRSASESQTMVQVGGAITEIDESTQQNASLVQESAIAAENLQSNANKLAAAVAAFKVNPANG